MLVAGAAGDIGAAAACRFAVDGARAVLTDRRADELEALSADMRAAAVAGLFAVIADLGPLDAAFINAAPPSAGSVASVLPVAVPPPQRVQPITSPGVPFSRSEFMPRPTQPRPN